MLFPLSQPSMSPREISLASEAVTTGWISGVGSFVPRFEQLLCQVVDRDHAIATASGTSALEVLLQGLGIGEGDEVIVPALTFAAPAAAVLQVGARPVLCDISRESWTIDVRAAEMLVSARTKAIIGVSVMGHPCDWSSLERLGVPLIEDAAQAHGSSYRDRQSGGFGVASVFSFHVNKAVTCGEGGAILTDDAQLARICRLIVNHGMTKDRPYYHEVVGRNARLNNVSAAIGVAQVERWRELTAGRESVWQAYRERLSTVQGARSRPESSDVRHSCWLATFSHANVQELVAGARGRGVDVRRIWPALTSLPLYRGYTRFECPVAEEVAATTAWLPTWSHMRETEVQRVVELVFSGTAG